jgi:hypothetical protein
LASKRKLNEFAQEIMNVMDYQKNVNLRDRRLALTYPCLDTKWNRRDARKLLLIPKENFKRNSSKDSFEVPTNYSIIAASETCSPESQISERTDSAATQEFRDTLSPAYISTKKASFSSRNGYLRKNSEFGDNLPALPVAVSRKPSNANQTNQTGKRVSLKLPEIPPVRLRPSMIHRSSTFNFLLQGSSHLPADYSSSTNLYNQRPNKTRLPKQILEKITSNEDLPNAILKNDSQLILGAKQVLEDELPKDQDLAKDIQSDFFGKTTAPAYIQCQNNAQSSHKIHFGIIHLI